MPIYEYYCAGNNKLYSFLARSHANRDRVPLCPDDPAFPLKKHLSNFAIIGKAREETEGDPFAGIDDAKMDGLMAEMESEMSSIDEENPNPRQIGHFMRKLTNLMGDKTPPQLREMIRRLESGEDPEKLESELGSLGDDESGDALFSQMKTLIRTVRPPSRDPKLYDLNDYLPPD